MNELMDLVHLERARYRMSLKELANEVNISVSYLADIESGKAKSRNTVILKKICKVLSIDEDSFIEAVLSDMKSDFIEAWGKEDVQL